MPDTALSFDKPKPEIRSSGKVVGITDRIYDIQGQTVVFDDVLVRGDLSGELEYNGRKLRVTHVNTIIGLEIVVSSQGSKGPRGPVWKGVECKVIK